MKTYRPADPETSAQRPSSHIAKLSRYFNALAFWLMVVHSSHEVDWMLPAHVLCALSHSTQCAARNCTHILASIMLRSRGQIISWAFNYPTARRYARPCTNDSTQKNALRAHFRPSRVQRYIEARQHNHFTTPPHPRDAKPVRSRVAACARLLLVEVFAQRAGFCVFDQHDDSEQQQAGLGHELKIDQ